MQIGQVESGDELLVVFANLIESSLAIVDQIHFIDGHNDVSNPQQRDDEAVSFGLG